jgi:hypothetical protein
MRTRTRRSAIISVLAVISIGFTGTGCSSSDDGASAAVSSPEVKPGQPYPGYSASIVPDPTSLEAETAEPTESTEPTQEPTPTPQVDSDVAREANLIPCEASLGLDVIDTTVKGASEVRLDETVVNDTSKFVLYSETCRYTLSGSGNRVASVTSTLLTKAGKLYFRDTCAKGDMNSKFLTGKPIGYQNYPNIDDGCTFVPKADAPSGSLPGFVLRYRGKMVTVYLSGFDTVANDGEAVIREVKLRS